MKVKTTTYLFVFVLLLGLSCNSKENTMTENHTSPKPTTNSSKPTYDVQNYLLLEENSNGGYDTLKKEASILRTNEIFIKNRKYIYSAIFSKENKTLSKSTVEMITNNERWDTEPNIQEEIIYEYDYSAQDSIDFAPYLNSLGINRAWKKQSRTGIIENVEKVWMHPIRDNQFVTTEVAPFPEVLLPLDIGKKWTGTINIGHGWGNWSNKSIATEYEVARRVEKQFPFSKEPINFWEVKAKSSFSFGTSHATFLFHPKYGFAEMVYQNYLNETITFQLISID